MKKNERVTSSDHFQETRLIKFGISKAQNQLSYQPGDVVMIQPSNVKENVKDFLGMGYFFNCCKLFYRFENSFLRFGRLAVQHLPNFSVKFVKFF